MSITRDPQLFLQRARALPFVDKPVCDGVFLVAPEHFRFCEDSARDNVYMREDCVFSQQRALQQHHALAQKLHALGVPVVSFPGEPDCPDGIFPNNAFATAPGRLILGAMKHPARQKETQRQDIRYWFEQGMGMEVHAIAGEGRVAELTGVLIIDRARRLGFCGMTERVNKAGLQAMVAAFGLQLAFQFELARGEYHTNVVMSVLASRAVVLQKDALIPTQAAEAIADFYEQRVIWISREQKNAFAGNCIAVTESDVLISQSGYDSLDETQRRQFSEYGFSLHPLPADEIEKAGGSIRCMVAEWFR